MGLAARGAKRQAKIAEWELRTKLLHEKIPRLGEISQLFARMALETGLLELSRGKMNLSGQELEKARAALLEERRGLLRAAGLSENIYEIWWDCPKCQDTGFVSPGVKCSCLLIEEMKENLELSGLAPEQSKQTFRGFSLDWYKDKKHMKNILTECLDFAEKIVTNQETENILMHGPVGTGKTHLCSAIANYCLEAGVRVMYLKVSPLLDLIRESKFNQESGAQEEQKKFLQSLYRVPLLIIDDLGTENLTDFAKEQLLLLFDGRINHRLPWVVSTNLNLKSLDAQYELRLIDRLVGTSRVLKFTGDSIRMRKAMQKEGEIQF